MNELFAEWGLLGWKPLLSSLALPPTPLLLLTLLGAWWLPRHRRLGWAVVATGLAGLWAVCTIALGAVLVHGLNHPPPPLDAAQIAALNRAPHTAVLVLGAGRRAYAPEYGGADLTPLSAERLRHGIWLARQTHLPLAYSGGLGFGSTPGLTEAQAAAKVAARDYGMQLRWTEDRSRDTAENARYSVELLHAAGVRSIVLVTHDFHQQRALRNFERAQQRQKLDLRIVPAPMGSHPGSDISLVDFLPSAEGFALTRNALHEWLGWLAGA